MLRRLLLLLAIGAVLLAVDRSQRDSAAGARQEALRVRLLVSEENAKRQVTFVRIEDGDGRAVLYGIGLDRQWRCVSFKGAPALGERIQQLALDVLQTRGVVLNEDPARPADYGLGTRSMRVISLHGAAMRANEPASDLICAVDIGSPVMGAEGCYARIHGQRAIWTVDMDPAAVCGREPTPRPSLLDPAMVPDSWHGDGPRLQSLTIQLPGRAPAVLTMRDKSITPEQAEKGEPGYEWVLTSAGDASGAEAIAPVTIATSYANHVLQAPWADIVDPALVPQLGFDRPRAALSLSGSGPPLRLLLGGRAPSGRSTVLCELNKIAFEIEPAQESLLFPPAELFAPEATANPWAPRQAPSTSPIPQLPGH
jgi:hypothetical protein